MLWTLGFFLEFFPQLISTTGSWEKVYGWVGGGENDSSVISLVKESKLLTFSYLYKSDLELTLTSLDQELDNNSRNLLHIYRPTKADTFKFKGMYFQQYRISIF